MNFGSAGGTSALTGWSSGQWSPATAYPAKTGVAWQGSSYVALHDVPAGGQNPAVDTTNWFKLAQGGGEIAYAEITAAYGVPVVAATVTDVPGLTVPVPAGSGPITVEAYIPEISIGWTAAATTANATTVLAFLLDESGVALQQSVFKGYAAGASTSQFGAINIKRRLLNSASAKTYRVALSVTGITNVNTILLWAGAGTGTPASSSTYGPAYLQVRGI